MRRLLTFVVLATTVLSVALLFQQTTAGSAPAASANVMRVAESKFASLAGPVGDIDCSGATDAVDALKLLRHVAGLPVSPAGGCPPLGSPAEGGIAGDIDCSDSVNAVDALAVLRLVAGLVSDPCSPPPEPQTSNELIDRALQDGAIDQETALIYKLYAAFDDPRLPPQYKGDDSRLFDATDVVASAAAQFDGLPTQAQEIVGPFLVPPYYEGSWWDLRYGEAAQAASTAPSSLTAAAPPCLPRDNCPLGTGWDYVDGAHVKVWYRNLTSDRARAEQIAWEVDTVIWPGLTNLMQEPLPDGGLPNNGGDGRLDIALGGVDRSVAPGYGCKATPAYLVLSADASNAVVAHEFMHTIQWAYDVQSGCVYPGEYAWLAEATAQWAMDYVYPGDNEEQDALPGYLLHGHYKPLETYDDSHEYGAYVFPFYLSHTSDPQVVSAIWANTQYMDSLKAIDSSINGGFEQRWPEFALYNFNRGSFDYYRKWDPPFEVWAGYLEGGGVTVDGPKIEEIAPPLEVEHLSAKYYNYHFDLDDVRSVAFYNGFTFGLSKLPLPGGAVYSPLPLMPDQRKGANVQAVMRINGEWRVEDWTNVGARYFCRDKASERLEELTLIYSNSRFEDRSPGSIIKPQDLPPTLLASNIGCFKWKGTSSVTRVHGGVTEVVSAANIVWAPFDCSGSSPVLTMAMCFTPVAGTVTWDVSGMDELGCTYSGHDVDNGTSLTGQLVINAYTLNGTFSRAYIAGGGSMKEVVQTRVCPDDVFNDEQSIGTWMEIDSNAWWTECPGDMCHVSADGSRISGTENDGDMSIQWSFTRLRE